MSSLRKTTLQSTLPLDCRILDYRNGKYQGQVQTGRLVREGMGILLDHNYLCAIGMWKKGNL